MLKLLLNKLRIKEGSQMGGLSCVLFDLRLESCRIGVGTTYACKGLYDEKQDLKKFSEEGTDTRGHAKRECSERGAVSEARYLWYRALGANAEEVVGFPLKIKGHACTSCLKFLCDSGPIFV